MKFIRQLKNAFRHMLAASGYEIYKRPYLPKGTDAFESLRAHWPHWRPRIIFDVGANVGQTVNRLRPLFPDAEIHSFEPVPSTFTALQSRMRDDTHTQCHCLAFAERSGEARMQLHRYSEQNSLSPALSGVSGSGGHDVKITLETVENFCAQHGISHIDLLKIDVEGFELPVLRGAGALLAAGAIDYIVVEAGLMPGNPRFTPLPTMIDYLRPHGFWLVGVYEQFGFRYNQGAEFCNALFALEKHLTPGDSASA